MKRKHILSTAIHAIAIGATGASLCLSQAVLAEEKAQQIDEVIVTGSAIKRKDLEGALPVQVYSREELDRTGAVTTTELMEKIPSMQGFTTPGDSVGGGGGGIRTASIHDIGEDYTLVLLNGRRMAPADSGSAIDISAIPMSMLDKVDVLTDGAGALYGSDAIAGVVNFQLKKEVEKTTVSARYSEPTAGEGETLDFDIITGFGSLANDGFALVGGFSHHEQKQLAAKDREFAKTGIIKVKHPETGQYGIFFNGSGNAIPGNATAIYIDTTKIDNPETKPDERSTSISFNPYLEANGACAKQNSQIGGQCFFDYTSTVEVVPESETDSVFLNGHYLVSDDLTAFTTLVYSENSLTARIAPYPSGNVPIPLDSALVSTYIKPYLSADQNANLTDVLGRWRALPAEGRSSEYSSDALHFVAGFEGSLGDINYSGAFTHSNNSKEQSYPTGWLLLDPFKSLVSSGGLDIFTTPDKIKPEEKAELAKTVYSGPWDAEDITINTVEGVGSMPLFELLGGDAVIAAGFDYRDATYKRTTSTANAKKLLLNVSRDTPYDMGRAQWGVYSELLMPFSQIEITASLRYDSIDAVDSVGVGSVAGGLNDTTYKISARWELSDELSVRASFGTGFKAPSMLQLAEPSKTPFGVTSGTYTCPFVTPDPLAAACLPGTFQAQVFREGNPELRPETSKQSTVGFVFTPSKDASITVDLWKVTIADVVERLNEQNFFADPTLYRELFSTATNEATKKEELAIIQLAVNGGQLNASGIDYTFSQAFDISFGELTTTLGGTYMLESESDLNGSSLGKFGSNEKVTFRNQLRLGIALEQEMFSHSISVNYKSGYVDQAQTVNLIDAQGVVDYGTDTDIQLTVPAYYTVNYQTKVKLMDDNLGITFGVANLLDKEPSVSLRTNGAGHQVGWDPRYTDAYGRTLFLRGEYTF